MVLAQDKVQPSFADSQKANAQTFRQYSLGYFDDETCRLEPIENPFGPKALPIRSE
jgi:hypothetical protein